MLVCDAAGVFGSTTPVVGGVGVLMSKFSCGIIGAAARGRCGCRALVAVVSDGVVVVVAPGAGGPGAVAVSGAAAAFDAAAPLVGVPGGLPAFLDRRSPAAATPAPRRSASSERRSSPVSARVGLRGCNP